MNAVEAKNMVDAMSRLDLDGRGRTLLGRLQYFANQPDPKTIPDIKARVEEISEIKRQIDANYDEWVKTPTAEAEYYMEGGEYIEYEEEIDSDFSDSDSEYSDSEYSVPEESPVSIPKQDGGAPKRLSWGPSVALAAITLFMATIG